MAFLEGRAAKTARMKANEARRELDARLTNRQAVINPYADVVSLESMISNPFANLQVATKASEMQAQQVDISLASTLDTLRAGGVGAGGATALAQAALQSKQGIAASIQQQEAANAQLRAQGEAQAQQLRMSEAQRMQEAGILGKTFMFQTGEERQVADISRSAAMQQQYEQQYQDAKAATKQMWASIVGGALGGLTTGFGGALGAAAGGKLINKVASGVAPV